MSLRVLGIAIAVLVSFALGAGRADAQVGEPATPEPVEFSETRGLRDTEFTLELTNPDPEATIRYSVNAAPPTVSSGQIYTAPIEISTTSYVQAIAVAEGVAGPRVVHTYVFPADVAEDPNLWSRVTGHATWGPQLDASLRSLPIVSIVTDGGISTAERETSFEIFDSASGIDAHAIAGVRKFGNASLRLPNNSMRIYFRGEYGPGRLSADLFDGFEHGVEPATRFDKLDLRSGHDTLTAGVGVHVSTRWVDSAMTSGGRLNPHVRPVFVYLNGRFWGLYQLRESFDDDFIEQYLGNDDEYLFAIWKDNDVIAPLRFQIVDGDPAEWDRLKDAAAAGYGEFVEVIGDPNALFDWHIHTSYGYHELEWNVAGNHRRGFSFSINDADKAFLVPGVRAGRISSPPAGLLATLARHDDPQFLRDVGDRVECVTTQGILAPEAAQAHWKRITDDVALAIIADSARWGSVRSQLPSDWRERIDAHTEQTISHLGGVAIDAFRTKGYFPEIDGVDVTVAADGLVTMEARGESDTIYYTLDGSDPAALDGAAGPGALLYQGPFRLAAGAVTIRARAHDDSQADPDDRWSASCPVEAAGAEGAGGSIESPVQFSEIHYNPEGPDGAEFIELRNDSATVTVDLGTLRIEGGVSYYAFGSGELLGPGEVVVLTDDAQAFEAAHGFGADGVFHRSLSNGGETIRLVSDLGHAYDQVTYGDDGDWPAAADGLGPSLERRSGVADNDAGTAWQASAVPGGTPGAVNSAGLVLGDADCDGAVDVGDVRIVLAGRLRARPAVTNCVSLGAGTAAARTRGDLDGDGTVDLRDAQLIARLLVE